MLNVRLFLLIWGLVGISFQLLAQKSSSYPPLIFKQNDRIVFLGSSLFENELEKGYLEFAITSRWPDRNLTFRNLGWTGDNVFAERSEEHTSELQSRGHLVCRLLLEKKKKQNE